MDLVKKILGGLVVAVIAVLGIVAGIEGQPLEISPLVTLGIALGGAVAAIIAVFVKKKE